ncbi:CAAX prenyl protease 1 homolog [Musca autumnalis]|uniref:CAAX prenyl protease 1 homolog n=1 Tax=Musca autumnalis TaxID=221902 RepID=UPI003CFAF0C4
MGASEAELILYAIIFLCIFENLFEIYISLRQVKVYKTAKNVPTELKEHMSEETFNKARIYGLDKEQFGIFKSILLDVVVIPLELYFGIISLFWQTSLDLVAKFNFDVNNEILVSCVFVVVIGLYGYVKELAFKVYGTFVLEEKHGFNKQTPGFFVWDQIKGLLVSNILTVLLSAAVVFIVQWGGEYFFIYLWAFAGIISLVLLTIYPIFIAPLFDKYTPLEEGELRTAIEKLAASLKFPLTKLYVVEGSKRSSHSNAYFYGLWNSKRIVLFDTLLLNKGKKDEAEIKEEDKGKGCTDEEVVAVLGHELGHWKLGHVTKNIVIMQVNLLLLFFVFNYCFKYAPFYEALGFAPGVRPILVGLFIVLTYVMAPYNAILGFALTMLSRRFEYQADEFAQKLGYAKLLQKALIKLNLDNLGFPVHDWLYSSWNHSHPTLLQRMNRLKELEAKDKKSQ